MKRLYTQTRLSLLLLFIAAASSLLSCVQDEFPLNGQQPSSTEGFLRIYLNTADLQDPKQGKAGTRAMDNTAEKKIDPDLLNILVFKTDTESSAEIFYYKAPVSGSIVIDETVRNRAVVTVKLVKSLSADEKYRIVVVGNYNMENITLLENITEKTDVMEQLAYAVPGKWNAGAADYTPFPMWGETRPVAITENTTLETVDLYRALARVDVGLNFRSEAGKLTENTNGLSEFKLKEINIFRTYNLGFVGPTNNTTPATEPFIPDNAVRRTDNSPLIYTIPEDTGVDRYVREIYLPEADAPASPTNQNTHCVVVGGYYKGSAEVSYYRLDFAADSPTGERAYQPVLRNHRYVFNITQVRGPGYVSTQAALVSTPTKDMLNYDVIVWDENIHELHVNGKYYFGLDQRDLKLTHQENDLKTISYQTNLPVTETISFEWKNGASSVFEVSSTDTGNQEITIRTKSDNTSTAAIIDTLYIKSGPFNIPVHVEQRYTNFAYSINPDSVKTSGIYFDNKALEEARHYISLTVTAEDRSIEGHPFLLETEDTNGEHGISFSAQGVFDFTDIPEGAPLTQKIRLVGSGTLNISSKGEPFTLTIKTNSSSGQTHPITIKPVGRKLRVLVLGNQETYGYNIAIPNVGSNKVIKSANNFGPYDYSVVKVEELELINANMPTEDPNSTTGLTKLRSWLTGTEPVDILYITYSVSIQSTLAGIIANYLNNNGVVICFYDGLGGSLPNIMNACFGVSNITQLSQAPVGGVFRLNGNPDDPADSYLTDPVLNGPFGDLRNKQWGEHATSATTLSNLPVNDIVVYSTGMPLNGTSVPADREKLVTGFRHKTKNLIFFGDGGFVASGSNGQPYLVNSATDYPLNWDTSTMYPIPYPGYGANNAKMPVYNTQVLCNTISWAIKRATYYGVNSK